MDTLRQDCAYALRRLWRAPGFTAVIVATLALGIGVNSAIFSVVNGVLLRPLPFPQPERLVRVAQVWEGRPVVFSPPNFLDIEKHAQAFLGLAAYSAGGVTLTGRGGPARIEGADVTANFFDVLGVLPRLGRAFERDETQPGRTKVAVLGHKLWTERFASEAGVIGQTIELNREPHTIVGVAPAGFSFPEGTELWVPLEYDARFHDSRGAWYLSAIGRLKPDASVVRAREEVATIADRLAQTYPNDNEKLGGTVLPLHDSLVGDVRQALLVLLGAVGLVLLIACVNVANLLLARTTSRGSELAVRSALGAGRRRLVGQLLTESVLLSAIGGGAGLLLGWLLLDILIALEPRGVPRLAEIDMDGTVLAFTAALSIVTGLIFGVVPALQTTRRQSAQTLRAGSRALLAGHGGRLRAGLVVGQIGLAMMLLAGAGLLIRSFQQLRRVDPGFASDSALTFRISLPDTAYAEEAQRAAFHQTLLDRLGALPGVRSAGGVAGLPLKGLRFNLSFVIEGRPPVPPAQQPTLETRVASVDYFRTMGIPILRGRSFTLSDGADAPHVILISDSAAKRFFPGQDPLGLRLTLGWGRGPGRPRAGGEIVGIAGDVKEVGLDEAAPAEVYLPYAQMPIHSMDVVLRTSVPPATLAEAARKVVHELDAELPLAAVQSLDQVVARSISEPRFYVLLLAAFAGMALFLAALGIFGVMSYGVLQRSREIGVRIALGAHTRDILRMVLKNAAVLSTVGVTLGLAGALALSRALSGLLFELSPNDPLTLATTAALLAGVALFASYLPARRASRVDPLVALRSE